MTAKTKACSKCLLDTTDPLISFDNEGVCSYCTNYEVVKQTINKQIQDKDKYKEETIRRLRQYKKGEYDCIVGVSGGVDSSYTCLLAKEWGLNPLLVHFDNGWNSELAVSNIRKLVDHCGFDLHTYVINWPEFKDLQRSFFKASVLDIEMLTDHAIMATLYGLTKKAKTRNVLSGNNIQTEYGMPPSWSWNKRDWTNIKSIHKQFGEGKIKTFPILSTWKWIVIKNFGLGMIFEEPLDHLRYIKKDAIKELEAMGWVYYGGKHYESVFTKFYQAYYLPRKFNIDKRKAHFSSLIRNAELSRDEGMAELEKPLYPESELSNDLDYVTKKLGFSLDEFEQVMNLPPKKHTDYKSDQPLFDFLLEVKAKLKNKE